MESQGLVQNCLGEAINKKKRPIMCEGERRVASRMIHLGMHPSQDAQLTLERKSLELRKKSGLKVRVGSFLGIDSHRSKQIRRKG